MRFLPFLAFLLLQTCQISTVTNGTDPTYNTLIVEAETAEADRDYFAAAAAYQRAYALRPKNSDVIFRAGELYARTRDYRAAAAAYALVPANIESWPLLGLRYGRALKQSGQTEEAERVLGNFRAGYNGSDRAIMGEIVDGELAGLALDRGSAETSTVANLGLGVNSRGDETGASRMTPDQLLFASQRGEQSRLLTSRQVAAEWQRATAPGGFPIISGGQFGTGSFSDDGRFYFFTICSGAGADEANRCEIYRTGRRLSGAWTTPERLSDNVNSAGSNNAYPTTVTLEDNRQILYFASNRPGGRGGMDVYRATQADAVDRVTFEDPVLLGPAINTAGDEITPAFDRPNQVLYFSSNGHPGLGGYDVFRAQRTNGLYDRAVNSLRPVNSPADDRGFTVPDAAGFSLFSSNRAWRSEKPTTTDDDLYQIGLSGSAPGLRASVYDEATRAVVTGVEVALYEILPGRQEREVARQTFPESTYSLPLEAGKSYRVVLRRAGYESADYRVQTDATGSSIYGRPIYLRGTGARPPVPGSGGRSNGGSPNPPGSSDPDLAPAAAAPTAFRIQVSAAKTFDPNEDRYAALKSIAELSSEAVPDRDLRRITLGYYPTLEAARAVLPDVQRAGFPDAFVVRYDYGKRYGRVR
ncbi:PD40 domain-containing protein [Neolewinella antarctica]|uniref:Tetratricopeptide (TPR) repeat protein n=1 Tax=Neolewinella antarctica TaxID=442734 RepID=A0ABX0XE43_9BACT|nr:PD40 domain-containing protein [Neolewinella antarctica]NJC27579.1 tetratricopeptide (TPR) repeat protein [Neolewinella antarctica]